MEYYVKGLLRTANRHECLHFSAFAKKCKCKIQRQAVFISPHPMGKADSQAIACHVRIRLLKSLLVMSTQKMVGRKENKPTLSPKITESAGTVKPLGIYRKR